MVKRSLATLTTVVLFVALVGVSATAANAASSPKSLRARVDAVGARFFAAQAQAATVDAEIRSLDQQLTRTRRQVATLQPVATAQAVQLYQSGTDGFSALFDTTNAMEAARRAELIARASDHTQALLDDFVNTSRTLERQRRELQHAHAAQAAVVAALSTQRAALEHALAQAQQAYRDRLAAEERARAIANSSTGSAGRITTVRVNLPANAPAPPAPLPVAPPAAPPSQGGTNPHHDDPFLVCTRTRESSGNYGAVNPAGYYGAYQFSQPTWDVTANHAGMPELIGVRPSQASEWDQDQLGWTLYQWQGTAPWGGLC